MDEHQTSNISHKKAKYQANPERHLLYNECKYHENPEARIKHQIQRYHENYEYKQIIKKKEVTRKS